MSAYPPQRDPLVADVGVRFRVPLPVVIPLGVLLLVAAVSIGFSRILLSVPAEAAVVIALVTAMNILGGCAVLALRPNESRSAWGELLLVVLYPVIIGIAIWGFGIGAETEAESAPAQQQVEGGGSNTVTAEGTAFATDTIELPAGEEQTITFQNDDPAALQHNIAIYESQGGEELFKGETIAGDSSIDYTIPPLEPGEYYFQCDLHPGMNGSVVVN